MSSTDVPSYAPIDLDWAEPADYWGFGWFEISVPNTVVVVLLVVVIVVAIVAPLPRRMVD